MKLKNRNAFTLLELILALGLTAVIFVGIAASFHVFMFTLTDQQKEIEQRQLARNLMTMIGNDLRAALQYKPNDVTGVENLAASELLVAGILEGGDSEEVIGFNGVGTIEDLEALQAGASIESLTEEEEDDPDVLTEEEEALLDCANCRPTLIGTAGQISVDVSRMPRVDEYNPLIASNRDRVQLPSDLKSVTYFVGRPEGGNQTSRNSLFDDQVNELGGLYRRNIDRAIANFADEEGIVDDTDIYADLVSPEVVELTFRYFDGEQWNTEWDNVDRGGFPLAVEIVVTLDPDRINSDNPTEYNGFDPNTMQRYRSVVNLPVSEIFEPDE